MSIPEEVRFTRIRPGLYKITGYGREGATIERGAETGKWWWHANKFISGETCGREDTLIEAKIEALKVLSWELPRR